MTLDPWLAPAGPLHVLREGLRLGQGVQSLRQKV